MSLGNIKKLSIVLIVVFIGASAISLSFVFRGQKKLEVVFLDVGQGDAIFITSVTGKQVLIDGGKYADVDTKIAAYMPFYDRSIDVVIATHPDLDHIGGLNTIIDRYDVDLFIHSGLLAGVSAYQELADSIIRSDTEIVTAQSGQTISIDEGTYIEILAPYPGVVSDDANEHSAIVRLVYGDTSVLLTGDASIFNEHDLVSVYGKRIESDILKLGHHGSKTSSSSLFLETVDPEYAVVSAGCGNNFGHPYADVIKRVEAQGINIHDTCKQGDIVFRSDNEEWVKK